jgi:hypothetical protein
VDVASGFGWSERVVEQIVREDTSRDRWNRLRTAVPPAAYFWYRESPVPLVPTSYVGRTGSFNPSMTRAGMAFVRLDPTGRLFVFMGVPPEYSESPGPWREADWPALFRQAGLDVTDFAPEAPRWTPPNVAADLQRAWVKGSLRVEAASFRGRPVWFEVIPAWRVADTCAPSPTPLGLLVGLFALVVFGGLCSSGRRPPAVTHAAAGIRTAHFTGRCVAAAGTPPICPHVDLTRRRSDGPFLNPPGSSSYTGWLCTWRSNRTRVAGPTRSSRGNGCWKGDSGIRWSAVTCSWVRLGIVSLIRPAARARLGAERCAAAGRSRCADGPITSRPVRVGASDVAQPVAPC